MYFRWPHDVMSVLLGTLNNTPEQLSFDETNLTRPPYPAVDAVATGDGLVHLWADLPGLRQEDLAVYIKDGILIIEGRKKAHYQGNERPVFLQVERMSLEFRRTFCLNYPVQEGSFSYTLSDGVLHISWRVLG